MTHGMSSIVKTITRITVFMIFLFGMYIVLHGHLTPGGGFAGGVIIALVYILYVLAYGKEKAEERIIKNKAVGVESLGVLMFLVLGLLGFGGGSFLLNVLPRGQEGKLLSAGLIPFYNVAIMLNVAGGLFAVFLTLITFSVIIRKEDEE
jgi:multisubunit Na+/H+ antiporter MnhB subunit